MSGDYSSQDKAVDQGVSSIDNPYSILNISTGASTEEIKASYKLLSRAFHPDKQPTVDHRETSQQYFLKLKGSYEILLDPALRLAFDEHGIKGVVFMTHNKNIYQSVSVLLKEIGDSADLLVNGQLSETDQKCLQQARQIFSEALQYNEFRENQSLKPNINGEIKIKCNMTHSAYLWGEGSELTPLEVEESSIAMSVTKGRGDGKTSMTFGGSGAALKGNGVGNLNLSLNHEPVQGTDMNIDLDVGAKPEDTKLTFGTSRVMASQTLFSTNMSSNKQETKLSFTTYRSMMENKVHGTCVLGLGLPYFQMQYAILSFSTTYPNQPKYTAKINFGVSYTPLELSAEKSFDEENKHTGKITWGWGAIGSDIKVNSSRYLSEYCNMTVGIHHNPLKGLTLLFQLRHGSVNFAVPVLVTSIVSPIYTMKSILMTSWIALVDASVGDLVQKGVKEIVADKSQSSEIRVLKREEMLLEREKVRNDAQRQIQLMEKPANIKRQREEKMNGLVILEAIYSVTDGDKIDVTTALMFWVVHSSLQLPSMTKSSMLGFYDIRHETVPEVGSGYLKSWVEVWKKMWYGDKLASLSTAPLEIPTLKIRYRYQGAVYEITVLDEEPVSLPSSKAMKLGGSRVIG